MVQLIYRGQERCECIGRLEAFRALNRIDHGAVVLCDCGTQWEFQVQRDGKMFWWVDSATPSDLKAKFWVASW